MLLDRLFRPAYVIALVAALGTVLSLAALWIASGDASLGEELARGNQARDPSERAAALAYLSLGFFLLLGLVAGVLDWRQRRIDSKRSGPRPKEKPASIERRHSTPVERVAGGHPEAIQLTPSKKFRKRLRLVGFLLVGLLVGGLGLFLWLSNPRNAPWILLIALFTLIPAGVLYTLFKRIGQIAIRIERDRITLMDMFGRRTTVKPDALIYTRNRLIAGNIAVPLRNNQGEIFEAEAIEQHLLPLLKNEQQMSEFGYLAKKLGSGEPKSWLGLVAILIMLIVVFWLEFAR